GPAAIARTPSETFPGFQDVAAPVVGSSSAMNCRLAPPMCPKKPPAKSLDPDSVMLYTALSEFGSQDVAVPVVASNSAMLFLNWPPMVLKAPPTYTVEPFASNS